MQDIEFLFPNVLQIIESQIKGPIPEGTVGLILPRSSSAKRGISIVPGVVDCDYQGILKVQVHTTLPMTIYEGDSVAQLVLLPYVKAGKESINFKTGGFGSTNASTELLALTKQISSNRPSMTFCLNEKPFSGILDSGADVSVIREVDWPDIWPCEPTPAVRGVGGLQEAKVSKNWLEVTHQNSKIVAKLKPIILPLHTNLWGRDLLEQFNAQFVFQE